MFTVDRCLTLCTFSFSHCVVLRYMDSDCPFSVFLWVNCKWFLYCQSKWNIYFKKHFQWEKNKDELAYKSRNTRKANQFSWKIIHNTVYNRSKIEKKIGSMNSLCLFFLYTRVETLKNLFDDCTVIQQNHIGVKKLHGSPLSTLGPLNFFTV